MLNDFENKIVELWHKSMTTAQIAVELNVTKNAICGKISRMRAKGVNLPMRGFVSPVEKFFGKPKPSVRRQPLFTAPIVEIKKEIKEEPKIKPVVVIKEPKLSKPLNIRFSQLKNNSCRYVVNDGPAETFIFCGSPKERGPYCEAHASICYVVPEKRQPQKKLYR